MTNQTHQAIDRLRQRVEQNEHSGRHYVEYLTLKDARLLLDLAQGHTEVKASTEPHLIFAGDVPEAEPRCDMPECNLPALPDRFIDMCRGHWDEFAVWARAKSEGLDAHTA